MQHTVGPTAGSPVTPVRGVCVCVCVSSFVLVLQVLNIQSELHIASGSVKPIHKLLERQLCEVYVHGDFTSCWHF